MRFTKICGCLLAVMAGLWVFSSHEPLAAAFPVTVDGDPSEWDLPAPPFPNLGHITRDVNNRGAYVWLDEPGDERTDLSNPDTQVDLLEFHVTGDASYLYLMAQMNDIVNVSGIGALMLQVALDLDRQPGSGAIDFGGFANTQVTNEARWEFLLATTFGSGSPQPRVWDTAFNDLSNADCQNTADASSDAVEIRVPWAVLGLSGPPSAPIRFTVMTCQADTDDNCRDLSAVSDALDVISNYGFPGRVDASRQTWTEVSDGDVDYSFDVWFDTQGEVYAPVLISEVFSNPNGSSEYEEFVDLVNVSQDNIDLTAWKVGDEETPGAGEGMHAFGVPGPGGSQVVPGQVVTIARRGTDFSYLFGFDPDFETTDSTSSAVHITAYSVWAAGLLNLSNGGDEVIVLDRSDTVMDVFLFGSGAWSTMTSFGTLSEGRSAERVPAGRDRDRCELDFVVRTTPTPGDLPTDKGLGEPCTDPAECATGFCADGFCCLEACGVDCDTCSNLGLCGPAAQGSPCEDGDLCTHDDQCSGTDVTCLSGTAYTCIPGLCQETSVCDGLGGCNITYLVVDTPCDDLDPCTLDTVCDGSGSCSGGTSYTCTPGTCEDDSVCDGSGGCTITYSPQNDPCEDGDACTFGEVCDGTGGCSGGTPYTCTPGLCEDDSVCDGTGGCTITYEVADTPCNDQDPCTEGTVCDGAGSCSGGTNICGSDGGVDGQVPPDGQVLPDGQVPPDGQVQHDAGPTVDAGSGFVVKGRSCECRAGASSPAAPSLVVLLMGLLLFGLRRRRGR